MWVGRHAVLVQDLLLLQEGEASQYGNPHTDHSTV